MLIYGAVIFLIVTAGSMTLLNWLFPNKSQRRLQQVTGTEGKVDWAKTVVSVAGPFVEKRPVHIFDSQVLMALKKCDRSRWC